MAFTARRAAVSAGCGLAFLLRRREPAGRVPLGSALAPSPTSAPISASIVEVAPGVEGVSDSRSPHRGGGDRSGGIGATTGGTPAIPAAGSGISGGSASPGRSAGGAPLIATGAAGTSASSPDGAVGPIPSVDGGAGSSVGTTRGAVGAPSPTCSVSRLYGTSWEAVPEYGMCAFGGALKTTGEVLTGPNLRGGAIGPRVCCSLVYRAHG